MATEDWEDVGGDAANLDHWRKEERMSEVDASYLLSAGAKEMVKSVAAMGQHLKELKGRLVEAEAVYEAAKKEYDYYANTILPIEMANSGFTRLDLEGGGILCYEKKYYCTPNKNEADKQKIAEWLRQVDGAHLIKERAAVDSAQIAKLKDAGIPYTEISDFNTNSLKAFLRDKIGASGGVQQIRVEDIPECIHFQEQGIVTIEV